MRSLVLKNMSSPGDTHPVYFIESGNVEVGAIETYIDPLTSTLVVRNFSIYESGFLTRKSLSEILGKLEKKTRQLKLDRLGIERLPQHKTMYESTGFSESEGDWGTIVSKFVQERSTER